MDDGRRGQPIWATVRRVDPRRLLPFVAAMALGCVLLTGWVVVREAGEPVPSGASADVGTPVSSPGRAARARQVLRSWDERRSAAWATGDVTALRSLYVRGSRSGRTDVGMLEEYVDRGLVVRGLQTQVLAVDLLRSGPGLLVLRVTDRVVGGEAVGQGEVARLPVDRPSTRRLGLRRVAGEWLVDEVRRMGGGAAG